MNQSLEQRNSSEFDYKIKGLISITEEDTKNEIRIINSFDNYIKQHYIKKINNDYYNEQELKDCIRIIIENQEYHFKYYHVFNNIGNYEIQYLISKNLTKANHIFADCESLTSLDFSEFNSEKIINMRNMFYNCKKLKGLNLSNLNTLNVSNMMEMFCSCESLEILDLSSFNTEKVTNMSLMFGNCISLTNIKLSSFNTLNVKHMVKMFSGCSSLTSLNLSNFYANSIKDVREMFENCTKLEYLNLQNFQITTNAREEDMFKNCNNLKTKIIPEKKKVNSNDNQKTSQNVQSKEKVAISGPSNNIGGGQTSSVEKINELGLKKNEEKTPSKKVDVSYSGNNNKSNISSEFKDNEVANNNNNSNNKKHDNNPGKNEENVETNQDGQGCKDGKCPCLII